MYFVQKEGVYIHGIAWIGDDPEEGEKQARSFASKDVDDYHTWVLYEYQPQYPEIDEDNWIGDRLRHLKIFSIKKGAN